MDYGLILGFLSSFNPQLHSTIISTLPTNPKNQPSSRPYPPCFKAMEQCSSFQILFDTNIAIYNPQLSPPSQPILKIDEVVDLILPASKHWNNGLLSKYYLTPIQPFTFKTSSKRFTEKISASSTFKTGLHCCKSGCKSVPFEGDAKVVIDALISSPSHAQAGPFERSLWSGTQLGTLGLSLYKLGIVSVLPINSILNWALVKAYGQGPQVPLLPL